MASRRRISAIVQQQVRQRANGLCEYCHTIEKWQYISFTIDHVVPIVKGGTNDIENLALACFHCNRRKSDHAMGFDPISGLLYNIFNPRREQWNEHFIWSVNCTEILGLTVIGRATIAKLDLNRPRILSIRLSDVAVGRHPPQDDPKMKE